MKERDAIKRSRIIGIALAIVLGVFAMACGETSEESAETATIAPAIPEPNVDVENDPALTKTVDPGEDRSPYEGGPLDDDEVVGGESPADPPPVTGTPD